MVFLRFRLGWIKCELLPILTYTPLQFCLDKLARGFEIVVLPTELIEGVA